jgi:hypothetical protein
LDLDVICCRGRFDSSWVLVFIDVPIANDAQALLQDRVLVLCGVGARYDFVVVVFVAMVVMGWFGSLRILCTMLTHFSFRKSSMGLMLCTRRDLSVDMQFCRYDVQEMALFFFALVDADANKGAP